MINYLIRLVLVGITVYMVPNFLGGVQIDTIQTAILVAFVMSVLNTFVKPILTILTIPITILTLGLFYLVVTAVIVYLCDYLIQGFSIDGFLTAIIFSFILSIVNSIVGSFQKKKWD
ncbi:putative membrane protein [Spirosomataceae bacterium TFI 002]|nr:putative membrane protein [Spirosomataceae bacterium TFI 002]